ncbi:MAG: hypothetical protein ACRDYA_20165, partial [Egibacteraceae bacterium]
RGIPRGSSTHDRGRAGVAREVASPAVWPSPMWVGLAACAAAVLLAPLVVVVPPLLLITGLAAVALIVAVYAHPPLAAYVLLATTPVVAGMDRGLVVPVLRPHEAIALLVAAGLLARGTTQLLAGRLQRPSVRALDVAIVLMAFTSSVLPLLWMVARGNSITTDDALYALTLWKFYGIYLIVRGSVRTEGQVRRCLWLSMAAAGLVAVVGILQSLQLLGVPELLARFYAIDGNVAEFREFRGGSTFNYPIAVADFLAFNLAIALGWLVRGGRHRSLLVAAAGLFLFGIVAAGQFSGAIALLVAVVAVGLLTGHLGRLGLAVLMAVPIAGVVLEPVIEGRLRGFSSAEGVPPSWISRLDNLQTFFWPKLFSGFNFLLGVRPEARIPLVEPGQTYVWIESGHTWLLWIGGVPFFVAFFVFLWVSMRTTFRIARARNDAIGVAAIASFTSLAVVAVLMALDPHLTMRGSADLLFSLLALASVAGVAEAHETIGEGA